MGCGAGSTISQCLRPTFTAPEGYNWQLELRFPIYTGGLNRSRIQQSVYTHRAATEALERVARQTERQARDAYLGVISEISRVAALRQAVESSRTALRAGEAGFEVGTRTTVDVLTLQDNLRQAETQFARSRYDYILNVLRLKQAAGSLAEPDIQQVDGWLKLRRRRSYWPPRRIASISAVVDRPGLNASTRTSPPFLITVSLPTISLTL